MTFDSLEEARKAAERDGVKFVYAFGHSSGITKYFTSTTWQHRQPAWTNPKGSF